MRTGLLVALLAWALTSQAQAPASHVDEIPSWFTESFLEFPQDVKDAARDGRRLMLYFWQEGCPFCKKLMQTTLADRAIAQRTREHFVAVALNIHGDREVQWTDGRTMREKELARALKIQGTPTLLFLDERGALVLRLTGYVPPERFAAALGEAAGRR
jgi:thioredoxin-related protein